MPDETETTLTVTLNLEHAIVVLTSLHDALDNHDNTDHYKDIANQLGVQLLRQMVDTWPKWSRSSAGDLDENGHYPGELTE